MFAAANTYHIRSASHEDVDTLNRFAALDSGKPFTGRVLIGYLDGVPAAVLSLDDGRVIADPSRHTDHLLANLRVRAIGVRAYQESSSLRQRLLAAIPEFRAQMSTAAATSRNGHIEHELLLNGASEQHAGVQHAEAPGIQAGVLVNA